MDNYNLTKNIYPTNKYENGLYNATKLSALCFAFNAIEPNSLPITIVSPSHIYDGYNQHPEDFIKTFVRELCKTGKIKLLKNTNVNYDNWINVFDIVQSYQIIFSQGFNKKNYNPFNPNQYYTNYELAQMIVHNIKKSTNYAKYIKVEENEYTFVPDFKNYYIKTNFLPNQLNLTNDFVEEVKKLSICCD